MTVAIKRSFKPAAISSGSITVMLYQMLKALPSRCGTSGANAVTSSGCRFNATSMAESNREESNARANFWIGSATPENLSFSQKRIRDLRARTCRPDDLAICNGAVIVGRLLRIAPGCPGARLQGSQDRRPLSAGPAAHRERRQNRYKFAFRPLRSQTQAAHPHTNPTLCPAVSRPRVALADIDRTEPSVKASRVAPQKHERS